MYFLNIEFLKDSDDDDLTAYSGEAEQSSPGACNPNKKQTGPSTSTSSTSMVTSNLHVLNTQTVRGTPSNSMTSYFTSTPPSAELLTSLNTSNLYGSLSTMQTTGVVPEASTSQMHDDDRLMKEKLIEMFPSIDIKLIEEAVHDSTELEEAVYILLNYVDDKSGKFTLFIFLRM